MKVNKYFLVFIVYFFFNSFGLPMGLLYTTLLSPFLYLWLVGKGKKKVLWYYFIYSLPFVCIHLLLGMNLGSFLKSYVLLFCSYLFTYAFAVFLKEKQNLGKFFKQLLLLNFGATLLAIVLYFTPWIEVLWTVRNLTLSIRDFPRMQLLTYEPSYYSTLFAPIVLFYVVKLFIEQHSTRDTIFYLILLALPLLLSFSLGVIATILISLFIFFFVYRKLFFQKKALFYSVASFVGIAFFTLLILLFFFPENPLFLRVQDIFTGKDLSARGRTVEAIKMASLVAQTKSLLFGVGIGQIKIMGDEVVRNYYNYHVSDIPIIRIPSAIGETIGTFGYFGLLLRLFIELYLFVKTRVFSNYYRTLVFIYIFLYQFTGSFLTNIAEYVLWVIAFTPAFEQFNSQSLKPKLLD